MDAEVVVVGGGIGGLTVAALLAARGVDVCLLERASIVGGCAASFDKFGYSFEQGYGLYALWEDEQIHQRVFAELPVDPPEVQLLDPSYVVRLPDGSDVSIDRETVVFEGNLKAVFPECAEAAITFYRECESLNAAVRRAQRKTPDLLNIAPRRNRFSFLTGNKDLEQILQADRQVTSAHLGGTSFRFRRFVDVQLQAFTQGNSEQVSYLFAALALSASRGGMFGIRGGASALSTRLADSIKQNGGRIRLNTPALRLTFNSAGKAIGVDLLSGERVAATKAIISNLTIWDTYGKLVGLNRTPSEIRPELKSRRGWGAYLLYLAWDEASARGAKSNRLLNLIDWHEGSELDPESSQLFFCAAPDWDTRAPEGKRAVTVHTFTDVDEWFTFHTDESDLEEKDQRMLETVWARLHQAMPELGSSVEVIDTATPRSYYEETRRKLGMVGGLAAGLNFLQRAEPCYQTAVPGLFLISDTVAPGGVGGLTVIAMALANKLTH